MNSGLWFRMDMVFLHRMKWLVFLTVFFMGIFPEFAQLPAQSGNPFELAYRLSDTATVAELQEIVTLEKEVIPGTEASPDLLENVSPELPVSPQERTVEAPLHSAGGIKEDGSDIDALAELLESRLEENPFEVSRIALKKKKITAPVEPPPKLVFTEPPNDSLTEDIEEYPDTSQIAVDTRQVVVLVDKPDPESKRLPDAGPDVEQPRGEKLSTIGLLVVFACVLLLLTFIVNMNRSFLNKVYRAAMNENFSSLLYRERKFSSVTALYYLGYAAFFINGGLFLYLLAWIFDWEIGREHALLTLIGIVTCVYLVKHLVLNVISTIFPVSKELNQYNFNILLFNILLGLVLLPVNVLLAFGPEGLLKPLAITGGVIVLLFYLFRQFRGLLITNRLLAQSPFHFFVYLCTIEILPILIVLKFF